MSKRTKHPNPTIQPNGGNVGGLKLELKLGLNLLLGLCTYADSLFCGSALFDV